MYSIVFNDPWKSKWHRMLSMAWMEFGYEHVSYEHVYLDNWTVIINFDNEENYVWFILKYMS